MNRKFVGIVVLALLATVWMSAAATAGPTYRPDGGFDAPALHADAQVTNGSILVSRVVPAQPGFVAVHDDSPTGTLGASIGHSDLVQPGLNVGVAVPVNASEIDENRSQLTVRLYEDTNDDGEFQFPGTDTPARGDNGIVETQIKVRKAEGSAAVAARPQPIHDGTVTIDDVALDRPGWLVVHASNNGTPGAVVGNSDPLDAGHNENVTVDVDRSMLAQGKNVVQLWAMAHVDDGNGTYDFPQADPPVTVNKTPVMTPFRTNLIRPALTVSEQTVRDATLNIDQIAVGGEAWLVVHPDADGSPDTDRVVAQRALSAGSDTNVAVQLSTNVTSERTMFPMLHWDDPLDGNYTFPSGGDPAVFEGGNVLIKSVTVSPPQTSSNGTDGGTEDGGTDGDENGSPGPGAALAAFAAAGAAIVARRRN